MQRRENSSRRKEEDLEALRREVRRLQEEVDYRMRIVGPLMRVLEPGPNFPLIDISDPHRDAGIAPQRGDILLSLEGLPDPDFIVNPLRDDEWGPGQTVHVRGLLSYLEFLELTILNERMLVAAIDCFSDVPREVKSTDDFDMYFLRYKLGTYRDDLSQPAIQLLADNQIYFPLDLTDAMIDGSSATHAASTMGQKFHLHFDDRVPSVDIRPSRRKR